MNDEVMTLWVRLKGAERERTIYMRNREKRSYASLMRVALDHYYDTHYAEEELVVIETA
jgi:hypothetical protein